MDGRKWVFDELVLDRENDVQGLVAYALYKAHKAEIANSKRDEGLSEEAIEQEVYTFHQNVVSSDLLLKQYRKQAGDLIQEISSQIEEEIRGEYDEKVIRINKHFLDKERQHEKDMEKLINQQNNKIISERKKAVTEFVRKVKQRPNERNLVRALSWQWNGFSGVFAAIISALIVGGIIYFNIPDDQKDGVVVSIVSEIIRDLSSF